MATQDSSGIGSPMPQPVNGATLRLVCAPESSENADGKGALGDDGIEQKDALLVESYDYMDIYQGTAEQLHAASLAQPHELPGQPGLPKVQAPYLPDGTLRSGKGGRSIWLIPGARVIKKLSARKFEVRLIVSEVEEKRRIAERDRNRETIAKERDLADAKEQAEAQLQCIERIKNEMALEDCEIVAIHRRSLQNRMEIHREWLDKALAEIEELSRGRPTLSRVSLTLAYSAGQGM